ncbi:flagellin [Alsobacter sp. KACC 23698]|uniref:Flagellin n=1 Tax=Alsobacter sp. KACC 23698 TaxID=3149229 RepID=A0AAU7JAU8_9HYPH
MAVAISTGVRNALASLQSVQSQSQVAQQHLATGRKVNSAVDNAVNFFTAAGLSDRSSQLSGLLDGMSNAVQTIQAASKGIDGITKLVQSAQSTIKQAQADALASRPTKSGSVGLSSTAEAALTGKSVKDTTLDKLVEGSVATATASSVGSVGVAASSDVVITAGSTTYKFATTSTMTVRDLVNNINNSGVATASIDDNGKFTLTGSGSSTLKFSVGTAASTDGASNTKLNGPSGSGFAGAADYTTGFATTATSTTRSNLIQQFNDLRTQIDQLSKDSGFNGSNLLDGNKLSIVFNEKTGSNQNKLDVQGQTITSANLGIGTAANGGSGTAGATNFQDDTELANAGQALTNALTSLRSFSSTLGSSLSIVQTRQDFTKSMIDTLSTGADNLVNADQNQEAATLLALQTRQQLSQTSLSLSNQADQGILRLF